MSKRISCYVKKIVAIHLSRDLLVLSTCLLAVMLCLTPLVSARSSFYSKSYVDGVVIKDASGNPIRLQGFNVEVGDIDEEGIQWMSNRGFNSLRIVFYWHRLEPYKGVYDQTYLRSLDDLLYWCEEHGIYASLDFHQWQWSPYFTWFGEAGSGFPKWLVNRYPNSAYGHKQCMIDFFLGQSYGKTARQEYINLWKFLVNRYKSNQHLWAYEAINEPLVAKSLSFSAQVADAVMNLYENEFTPMIRGLDSKTIIIYHHLAGNMARARKVTYNNIVWARSWYDFMYGGYYPSIEYSALVSQLKAIKDLYNGKCSTPFIVSEMGLYVGTWNAEQWTRDSFAAMRSIGVNKGYASYSSWIYHKGEKYGFQTPIDYDGSDTWIVSLLREYL